MLGLAKLADEIAPCASQCFRQRSGFRPAAQQKGAQQQETAQKGQDCRDEKGQGRVTCS